MPSATPGSESNAPIVHVNPSMASSYVAPLPARRDVDTLATLAADQGYRGRLLGPADGGATPSGVAGVEYPTGQFVNPAVLTNPQYTVNSSINSIGQGPVLTGGAVGIGGSTVTGISTVTSGAATAAVTTPATTAPAGGTLPTTAGIVNGTIGTTGTSMPAALSTPNAQNAVNGGPVILNAQPLLNPGNIGNPLTTTVSPAGTASPLMAANPPVGSLTTTPRTLATITPSAATTAGGTLAKPIVIMQGATGAITISNVGTATGAATTSAHGHAIKP